jgi:acylpyruvate hydrolase
MKILCVGRNYVEHIKELNNDMPTEPIIFMKPDTAINRMRDFYIPDYSDNIHYEVELVLKINTIGKNIPVQFAHKYYDEIAVGIDFTARDIQNKAMEKGHPWLIAKGFDNSAPISKFLPKSRFSDMNNIQFGLKVNDEDRQKGNSGLMINNFDYLIHYISRFITLKIGDLIFTGTPAGVGPVKAGDKLKAYIEDEVLLEINIR